MFRMLIMNLLKKLIIGYLVLLALFTVFIIGVHIIPKSAIADNIVSSTKVLEEEGLYKKFFNFKLFQMDNFTDAYMLNLAASADSDKPVEAGMMNYSYRSKNYMNLAFDTEQVAKGDHEDLNKSSYGRYWQGYQVTLRPLLTFMDYKGIRILNYILFSVLVVYMLWMIKTEISAMVATVFGISLLLINFPIVPYSMQFSTCFYLAFISVILILKMPVLSSSRNNLLCTFFVIGGVTSYMDFLTTPQLTLGLPLIVYMLMKKSKESWKTVIVISIAWALGYGMLWASKWMMGYILTGNNILADAMQSAELRTSNSYKGIEMTIPNIIKFIWDNINAMGLTYLLYLCLAIMIVFIGLYCKVLKSKTVFKEYSWLLLVAMIVPIWFLVLRNHSIQHGWFTWRAGLLSIISLILFVAYTIDIKKIIRIK